MQSSQGGQGDRTFTFESEEDWNQLEMRDYTSCDSLRYAVDTTILSQTLLPIRITFDESRAIAVARSKQAGEYGRNILPILHPQIPNVHFKSDLPCSVTPPSASLSSIGIHLGSWHFRKHRSKESTLVEE